MRDGVELHTVWTLPTLDLKPPAGKRYTTVLDRSPYGETGTELVADVFLPLGYAAVGQDFRGTKLSGGLFDLWRNSHNDTADTVRWIVAQPWSDGVVYQVGGSADGIAALVLAGQSPIPEIKKQFIIWATATPYDSVFPGGAYRQALIDGWLKGTVKNHAALQLEVFGHESPADPWWQDVTPAWKNAQAPTVFWAGWNDIFLNGNLAAYEGWQNDAPTGVRGRSWLVVDPLGHCQGAAGQYRGDTVLGRNAIAALLAIALFDGSLEANPPRIPEGVKRVTFYVMGAAPKLLQPREPGNYWCSLDKWPKYTPTAFYPDTTGKLAQTRPIAAKGALHFRYDPRDPVPTRGGNNLEIHCGPDDQREVEVRPDVLVFTSDVLKEPLAITGPVSAELFVSSTNVNDTDWTAKLTDVDPSGVSRLVQDGIVRMRWRSHRLAPEPVVPGEVTNITVSLWSTSYIFGAGHRIRLAVSSSNYPRFAPNPNTGLPLLIAAPRGSNRTVVAENTLHMGTKGRIHRIPIFYLSFSFFLVCYDALEPTV